MADGILATPAVDKPCDTPGMFERFTERARQVVVLAQDEARSIRENGRAVGDDDLVYGQ